MKSKNHTTENDEDNDLKVQEKKLDSIFRSGVVVVVLTLVGYGAFIYFSFSRWEDRGTFGDMFGGITSLFTGLAYVGLIYTIYQQKIQLEMQRRELRLQRKELADTREEFVEQNKTMRLQRFENTFYQLVELHNNIVSQYLTPFQGLNNQGIPALVSRLNTFLGSPKMINKDEYYTLAKKHDIEEHSEELRLVNVYYHFYDSVKDTLGQYYRHLYNTILFVDQTFWLGETEKAFYVNIIKSILSHSELFLLFYHSISPEHGYPQFMQLVVKYDILEHLSREDISKAHVDVFNSVAERAKNN